MSAETSNQSANKSAKKRTFHTISNRKPQFFTFPKNKVEQHLQRAYTEKGHNFSAVPNERIKSYYGSIGTPKGGKRSGQKTRRHRNRRTRRNY